MNIHIYINIMNNIMVLEDGLIFDMIDIYNPEDRI